MREPRWRVLLRKSISAFVAAIEIYNKPVMPHRDETFAMLAVSAWELLLKARLVRDAKNRIQARCLAPGPCVGMLTDRNLPQRQVGECGMGP